MDWNSFHANSFEVITHQFTIVNTIVYFLKLSLIFSRWWISLPNCKVKKSVYRYNIGIMLQVYRYRKFFISSVEDGRSWQFQIRTKSQSLENRYLECKSYKCRINSSLEQLRKIHQFFSTCVHDFHLRLRYNYRIKSICNIGWNIFLFILIHCGIIQNILWGPISFTYEWMFLTCRQWY